MANIIQQLEDLKEWGQDPTRYARRLAFRSTIPYGEVIDEDFDELSTREDEYYRKGPWKTSREDYQKGQLVEPGPGRPGYSAKKGMKQPNKIMRREYPSEQFDEFADAVLDAYAKDDITKMIDPTYKSNINRVKINKYDNLDKLVKKTGLDEETIFNLFDDREAYIELDLSEEFRTGRPVEKGKAKFYKQTENWIVKNSKRYADPDKFKKAFIRTFGKNNDLIQKINKPEVLGKRGSTLTSVPFSDWFRTNIMGSSEQAMKGQVKPSYSANQLDHIFKTAIYTNNENVRNKIIKELTDILPEKGSKRVPDIRLKFQNSPILKKFGLNQRIEGPIARLLAKEVGDDLLKQVSLFRKPWLGTPELLTYLKDRVDPKYKSMFEETSKAVKYAQKNQWPEAKKALNISESIMFDHKIPKALMELGYADDIEYIKVTPTSKEFNTRIKRIDFDMPMIDLTKEWKKAQTLDAKLKVVGEMNTLKDKFSKKYGNYLDDVKITPDKTGKPIFSSKTPVVTKKTDLIKMLETSLGQEKFPTLSGKNKIKFLQATGFPIDKCLSRGVGGSIDKCITGVVNETIEKAKRGDADAIKIFKNQKQVLKQAAKRGTGLATKLSWFLGPVDAPIELAFALPHLLMGDYEAAKRATTAGLFGWGKVDLDNVDDPEARKYLKHTKDTADWINNWEKHDYYTNKLENLPDDASLALRNTVEAEVNTRASNMDSIAQNYDGYDQSGSENEAWAYNPEEMAGKKAARNWINTKVETDLDKQLDKTYGPSDIMGVDIDLGPYKEEVREKLRASPTDLESYIKTKGQDFSGDPEGWFFYKPLKQQEAEAYGVGGIYDDYHMGALSGKDIRESYSSIPLEYASQLGALEKKEWAEDPRTVQPSAAEEWIWNKKHGYAGGGIAGVRRPNAIPPVSGPMPQGGGLSTMFNRVKPW